MICDHLFDKCMTRWHSKEKEREGGLSHRQLYALIFIKLQDYKKLEE